MAQGAFPEAFAQALRRRGVSLAWLHRRLVERGRPVSRASLSYWRSGTRQPERATSLDALDEIEHLLDVPPGDLVSLLGPSRRPGPRPGERSVRELLAETPGFLAALERLGFEGLSDELTEHVRHVTVDVDASGLMTGVQVRAVMQGRHDGARRTPVFVSLDDAGRAPRFVPGPGCRLGRSSLDPDAGVYAAELLLDRSLAKDDLAVYELHVELPEASADTFFDHLAARRMAQLMIWARFDPGRVPQRVERHSRTDEGVRREEIDLAGGSTAHAFARGFGPGLLGLHWWW